MRRNTGRLVGSGLLLALLCTSVFAIKAGGQDAPDQAHKIQTGDVLYMDVYRRPELSSSVQVNSNGAVDVPYVGAVSISGMTEQEASAAIATSMKAILKNPRVTVSRTGGAAPKGDSARAPDMKTQIIPLNNSNAEDLAVSMQGMTSQGGTIGADRGTNSLIITDTPSAIQNIMTAVEQLDKMPSQVTQVQIEAKIAEVEQGAMKEVGIRWFAQGTEVAAGYYPPRSQTATSNSSLTGVDSMANERVGGGSGAGNAGLDRRFVNEKFDRRVNIPVQVPVMGQMFFGLLNDHVDLGMLIDAMVKDNKAELLATPYITTVNHEQAEIKMTDEFPYTESSQTFGTFAYSVKFLDLGIKLLVTPHVYKDGEGPYIKLDLNPEVSFANGMANGVPIRSVRSSNSVANVRDGQTLVIGGIVLNDDRNVQQSVPGLGKIPLVGSLFKRKEKAKSRNELMVFVTPRIHGSPETITWDRMLNLTGAGKDEKPAIPPADPNVQPQKE